MYVTFSHSVICMATEKVVSIGVADFPPYSIVDGENISGAEVDIIRQSLELMGYKVKLKTYPYGRLPTAFRSHKIDGTIVTLKNFTDVEVYYSEIVLPEYQTVAVHLTGNEFTINSISDLKDKSIIAHQRARLFYGKEFGEIAKTTNYQETARQKAQVLMLFRERIDVIVLAHEIFHYYRNTAEYTEKAKPYTASKIFGEKFGFHNVFWDKQVRDDFNAGLKAIRENGTYAKILQKYLQEFKTE